MPASDGTSGSRARPSPLDALGAARDLEVVDGVVRLGRPRLHAGRDVAVRADARRDAVAGDRDEEPSRTPPDAGHEAIGPSEREVLEPPRAGDRPELMRAARGSARRRPCARSRGRGRIRGTRAHGPAGQELVSSSARRARARRRSRRRSGPRSRDDGGHGRHDDVVVVRCAQVDRARPLGDLVARRLVPARDRRGRRSLVLGQDEREHRLDLLDGRAGDVEAQAPGAADVVSVSSQW
jgi:hypothetical protein